MIPPDSVTCLFSRSLNSEVDRAMIMVQASAMSGIGVEIERSMATRGRKGEIHTQR